MTEDGSGLRMEDAVRTILKSNPAQVIALAASEEGNSCTLEDILIEPVANKPFLKPAPQWQQLPGDRPKYEHLALKGHEGPSLLLGLRASSGSEARLIECERQYHGRYKRYSAYTRSLLGQVTTDYKVGHIGRTHKVQLIHLHRHFAGDSREDQLSKFWDYLARTSKHVDVLMGDFGVALFCVIPELRSRGVTIDLAAWFPWKRVDGTPCADTCGIFFIDRPGSYHLCKGLTDLHANDASGILWSTPECKSQSRYFHVFPDVSIDECDRAEPGIPLTDFRPGALRGVVDHCLRQTLTPSRVRSRQAGQPLFRVRQKPLPSATAFYCMGNDGKTKHHPLLCFTQNKSRRSKAGLARRQEARQPQQSRRGSAARGPSSSAGVEDQSTPQSRLHRHRGRPLSPHPPSQPPPPWKVARRK